MVLRKKTSGTTAGTKKEREAAIALFKNRWTTAHEAAQSRFAYFREMQSVYEGLDDVPQAIRDQLEQLIKIKWAWWNWKTVEPRIADPSPRLEFKPLAPKNQQTSDVLKIIIRAQLEQGQFVLEQIQMLHDGGILGFNVNQILWHQKSETFKIRQPLTDEQRAQVEKGKVIEPVFIEEEKITENYALIRRKDPFDFFPDPKATNDQTWAYVFDQVWMSEADIRARIAEGVWEGLNELDFSDVSKEGDTDDDRPNESPEEAKARRDGKYAVRTMWGADGQKITMIGDVLLENTRNQYAHGKIPFVCWSTQPKGNSLYGESEMEKLRDLQRNIWVSDTLRRQAYMKAQNAGFIADPGVTIPKNRIGGFIIRAIQGQRVEELKFDANQGPSLTESDNMLSAMQEMSGAAGVAGFNNPQDLNRMTATVGGISQEEGNMRMMWKKLWFRLMTARAARFMVQLDHQYMSEMEIQRICGDLAEGYTAPAPEEIPMFLEVVPEALSEQMGMLAERNSQIELLNIVGPLNGQQMHDGSVFTIKPVIEDTIKSYQKDTSRYFNYPPQQAVDPITGQPITGVPLDPNTGLPIPQATEAAGIQPGQQSAQPLPDAKQDVQAMSGVQ